jgi:hypothetical protein
MEKDRQTNKQTRKQKGRIKGTKREQNGYTENERKKTELLVSYFI